MRCTSSCAASKPRTTRRAAQLLREPLAEQPDEVYRALLTVILRLVFLLYAEERDMLPGDETFVRFYSLAGLYERLREDAARYPDTMDQRYGAWAQLLALFRMVHDGARGRRLRHAAASRRSVRPRPVPVPRGPRRSVARGRSTSGSSRRSCPTALSIARSTSCSCSTASGSPTGRSTSSRSARCTRR